MPYSIVGACEASTRISATSRIGPSGSLELSGWTSREGHLTSRCSRRRRTGAVGVRKHGVRGAAAEHVVVRQDRNASNRMVLMKAQSVRMRSAVLVLGLLFFSGCGVDPGSDFTAPQLARGTLVGTVARSDGGVATGLRVEMVRLTNCFLCGPPAQEHVTPFTTDGAGGFTFENAVATEYYVRFGTYAGYVTSGERRAVIRPDAVNTVTFVLQRVVEE